MVFKILFHLAGALTVTRTQVSVCVNSQLSPLRGSLKASSRQIDPFAFIVKEP